MAWTQKSKPSKSGSQKRSGNSNNNADQARARAKAAMTQAEGKAKKAAVAKAARDNNAGDAAAKGRARNNKQKAVRATVAKSQAVSANKENKGPVRARNNKQKPAAKPKSFLSKMWNFIDSGKQPSKPSPAPTGAVWGQGHPSQLSAVMQTPKLSGQGMQDAGAYYPQGFGKQLETPSSMLGWASAAMNPMAAIANQAGKVALNQTRYGMNEEAAIEYERLLSDPANAGKSEKELVSLARQPQLDKQLQHAFINDATGSTATEAQLDAMRPFIKDLNMSEAQWSNLPKGMKQALARGANVNANSGVVAGGGGGNAGNAGNAGMLTGVPVAAPQTPTLGQLTTGSYVNPTGAPSWAPQPYEAVQNNWAPQWNSQWMPQQSGMFTKPRS